MCRRFEPAPDHLGLQTSVPATKNLKNPRRSFGCGFSFCLQICSRQSARQKTSSFSIVATVLGIDCDDRTCRALRNEMAELDLPTLRCILIAQQGV